MNTVAHITMFLCFSLFLNAQMEDRIWIFGDSAGIDFGDTSLIVTFSSHSKANDEVYASIADSNGQLLFFINGKHSNNSNYSSNLYMELWNTSAIMENGDSLLCYYSVTQGAIIIAQPKFEGLFYVFHINRVSDGSSFNKLYYSKVDIKENNGGGRVIEKNISLLADSITEHMNAVKQANGVDWWLIVHPLNTADFVILSITEAGIQFSSRQSIGTFVDDNWPWGGESEFTSDGNTFAWADADGYLDVYSFDRCSGVFSSQIHHFQISNFTPYGCAFSSHGRLLYVSGYNRIYQIDLMDTNPFQNASLIYNDNIATSLIGQMQLAPDNKIYISHPFNNLNSPHKDSFNTHLSVIHKPDSAASACQLKPFSFPLQHKRTRWGLPNMPNYNLGPLPTYQADAGPNQTICAGEQTTLGKPAIDSLFYQWTVDSNSWQSNLAQPTVVPTTTTSYYLMIDDTAGTYSCALRWDTVTVFIAPPINGNVAVSQNPICPGDTIDFYATGGTNYLWQPPDYLSDTNINKPNAAPPVNITYIVTISDSNGCSDVDTVHIVVLPEDSCVVGIAPAVGITCGNPNGNPNGNAPCLHIWPNPAQNTLHLQLSVPNIGTESLHLEVYTSLGETIHTSNEIKNRQIHIKTLDWPAGLYFVSLVSERGVVVQKLVVR